MISEADTKKVLIDLLKTNDARLTVGSTWMEYVVGKDQWFVSHQTGSHRSVVIYIGDIFGAIAAMKELID